MLKHALKLGFRNLIKNKINSFIHIFSLALGVTILLLISIFINNELSIDDFHSNSSMIYKISYDKSSGTPGPLAELLKNNFPEIKNATHIEIHQISAFSSVLNYNNQSFEFESYYSVDPYFFDVFDFQVLEGNIKKALISPFSIIITENEARRLFKNENPIGKNLKMKSYQDFDFTVNAIVKDIPQNSSIKFNGLITESSVRKMGRNYPDNWGYSVYESYIHLNPNVNATNLETKLRSYLVEFYNTNLSAYACYADAQLNPLCLHPLKDVYFNKYLTNDTTNNGNLFLIRILIAIGILIMILSIINYVNLTTARVSLRNKEIGLQKVNGAKKSDLIFQYLTETTIVSFFAVIIGFVLTIILLPAFSHFMGFDYSLRLPYYFILISIPGIILIGIIAGLYPAFFLSSQKVINVLQKNSRFRHTGTNIRYSLVVFQFFISISLIAVTLLIVKQVNYVKNKDLGFKKENVIYAKLPFEIMRGKKDIFRERILNLPGIENVAFSSTVFGKISGLNSQVIEGKTFNFTSLWVDPEFIELYDLQLKSGRFFSKQHSSDVNSTVLLNETAVKEFNVKDPFLIEITIPGGKAKVVGIVKDFNYKSLHHQIEPITIVYLPRQGAFANIKLSGNNITQSLEDIGKVWNDLAPEIPFSYHFLDSSFDRLYKSDEQMGKAISYFSLIAILIAILGILSLTIFLCESRIKEIGIRKINGAKIWQVILTLNKDFVFNLLIAFIISCPFSWFLMRNWLDNFAYKTIISPLIFIGSGLIVAIISLIIVSWQSWRFAVKNPVDTLRYE